MFEKVQNRLHEHNELVRLFKTSLDTMHSDDRWRSCKQFNALTINNVTVVIVGDNVESRDVVLIHRDGAQLQRVYETLQSYDTLQYLLMFCIIQYKDGQSNNRFVYTSSLIFILQLSSNSHFRRRK